jgi:hypothetical protein
MEEEFYGASGTDPRSIAGMGVLNSLSGGRGDLVQQYVNEAVPLPKKADPYVAALKFFIEMGKQASQPGATVLGSITGSMGAPVDYLEAKALERQKAEQARSALGLQIAPSLKPPKMLQVLERVFKLLVLMASHNLCLLLKQLGRAQNLI